MTERHCKQPTTFKKDMTLQGIAPMKTRTYRSPEILSRWLAVAVMALGVFLICYSPVWGKPREPYGRQAELQSPGFRQDFLGPGWKSSDPPGIKRMIMARERGKGRRPDRWERLENSRGYDEGLPLEEKSRLDRKFKEWRSLSPDKQRLLRHRMKRWMQLPPKDRALFKKRFDQWQTLTPEDREHIREGLERWDSLSPQEKEQIRRRFRK